MKVKINGVEIETEVGCQIDVAADGSIKITKPIVAYEYGTILTQTGSAKFAPYQSPGGLHP